MNLCEFNQSRDKRKDNNYFETFFQEETNRLDWFQTELNNNKIRADRILPVLKTMYDIRYNMMIAKYSAGYPLEEVRKDYLEIVNGMFQYWRDDPELSKRINMVCIGILLEIEDAHFDVVAKFIIETGEKEYVFDFLIHSRKPEWEISERVRFGAVFNWIKQVTQMKKTDAEAFLKQYLDDKWYATHADFYWYDNHKSRVNTYFGYWCFEAGAIVKIMGLDDSGLKENPYYPYDLVHGKNGEPH